MGAVSCDAPSMKRAADFHREQEAARLQTETEAKKKNEKAATTPAPATAADADVVGVSQAVTAEV